MKWNYEKCAAIAAGFSRKKDFREKADPAFQWLRRNGLVDQACAHMIIMRRDLSDPEVGQIAGGYQTRRSFKLGDQSAYKTAIKRGILDQVCAHMTERYRVLTDEQICEIASNFSTRSAFLDGDSPAYQTAQKRGILESICQHMDGRNGNRRLSNDEILSIAKQFPSRNDFKLGDFGAYTTAIRRGLIVEACAHMEYGAWGFREDRPAVLYQFRMQMTCGQILYKVGITNRKPRQRLATMGLNPGIIAELDGYVDFAIGRDARMTEKRLHKEFRAYRYAGPSVMSNGNTELFTVRIIPE